MASETFEGTQPIRVLQNFITSKFENTNSEFLSITQNTINHLGLDPGIAYHLNEFPIIQKVDNHTQTPYVKNNKIHIHETFLSFVWCMSYSIVSVYELIDDFRGSPNSDLSNEKIKQSLNVFNYGMYIIKDFIAWDKNQLPNPEIINPKDKINIERANIIFIYAMNFILCHEFAHIENQHSHSTIEFEKQADKRAVELMLQGKTAKSKDEISAGMLMGLCCLLFFSEVTVSKRDTHPDTDTRINDLLEFLNPEIKDFSWGFAYLAYRLWDYKFSKSYPWPDNFNSPKELYQQFYALLQKEKGKSLS